MFSVTPGPSAYNTNNNNNNKLQVPELLHMGNTLRTLRIRSNSPALLQMVRRSISSTSAASSPKSSKSRSHTSSKYALPAILEQHKEYNNRVFEFAEERARLETVENRSAIQEIQLALKREQLRDARLALENVTRAMLKCADPHDTDTRVFTSADRTFIQRVTGTSLDWCKWNLLDEINAGYHNDIFPSKSFEKLFVENCGVFCMYKEAGRRTVLDMF